MNIDKLPKWAQQEIRSLKAEVEKWKAATTLATLPKGTPAPVGSMFVYLGDGVEERAILPWRTVYIQTGTDLFDRVSVAYDTSNLMRSVTLRGKGEIAVYPQAANTIRVVG